MKILQTHLAFLQFLLVFSDRLGYNAKHNELMAVFTVHNFNTGESNAIRIYDSQDSVEFAGFGNWYYLAIRCIKK